MAGYYNPSLAAQTKFDEFNTERMLMQRNGLGDLWERQNRPWKFEGESGSGSSSMFGGGSSAGANSMFGGGLGGGMKAMTEQAKDLARFRRNLDREQMEDASLFRRREADADFARRQQEIGSARSAAMAAFGL